MNKDTSIITNKSNLKENEDNFDDLFSDEEENNNNINTEIKFKYFPYEPYGSQQKLMEELYRLLNNKKIGVFESPTGTGKTLTVISSILQYFDNRQKDEKYNNKDIIKQDKDCNGDCNGINNDFVSELAKESNSDFSWLNNFGKRSIKKNNEYDSNKANSTSIGFNIKKAKLDTFTTTLLNDWRNNITTDTLSNNYDDDLISNNLDMKIKELENKDLSNRFLKIKFEEERGSDSNNKEKIQVIYLTRTHSQISQILDEFKKIKYNYIKNNNSNNSNSNTNFSFFPYTISSFVSRKQLCVNSHINKISNSLILNDSCKELIKKSNANTNTTNSMNNKESCKYYQPLSTKSTEAKVNSSFVNKYNEKNNIKIFTQKQTLTEKLAEEALENNLDIEEINNLGKRLSACPYYASKINLAKADIIVMPYNSVICNKVRNNLELKLHNKIIVFDESHNLIDNVLSNYSSEVSFKECFCLLFGFKLYLSYYNTRLSSSNSYYLKQCISFIEKVFIYFIRLNVKTIVGNKIYLSETARLNNEKEIRNTYIGNKSNNDKQNKKNKQNTSSLFISLNEFFLDAEFPNINVFKLILFLELSELHHKIHSLIKKELKLIEKNDSEIKASHHNKQNINSIKNNSGKISNCTKQVITDVSYIIKKEKEKCFNHIKNDISSEVGDSIISRKELDEIIVIDDSEKLLTENIVNILNIFIDITDSKNKQENEGNLTNKLQSLLMLVIYLDDDGKMVFNNSNQKESNNNNKYKESSNKANPIILDEDINNKNIFDLLFTLKLSTSIKKNCSNKSEKNIQSNNAFNKLNNLYLVSFNHLKYVMLNPNREFNYILKNAFKVLFIGGTMKPLEQFKLLLKDFNEDEVLYYEADHVIPKDNILCRIISKNEFSNNNYDYSNNLYFSHSNMKNYGEWLKQSVFNYLAFIISAIRSCNNMSNIQYKGKGGNKDRNLNKGILVFVSSYDILNNFNEYYDKTIKSKNTNNDDKDSFSNIRFFFESKHDKEGLVFNKYKISLKFLQVNNVNDCNINCLNDSSISVLFAVIGGKLSEGINFNDELARVVLIVGLPFSNLYSTEIICKKEYYDNMFKQKLSSINGQDYYESQCMKAVNQAIGRAIRHVKDYSVILLFDCRYNNIEIKKKIPTWLNSKASECNSILKSEIVDFFNYNYKES